MRATRRTTKLLAWLAVLLLSPAAGAWQNKGLRLRARAQLRYSLEENAQSEEWSDFFQLLRARLDGRWKPADWIRFVMEVDLAERARPKDVFVRMDLFPLLRITAGQFKKPFSRLKMESPFKLLVPERGLLDRFAVADTYYGGYGGRDIGLMVSGTWDGPVGLHYYLGAFNNPLDDDFYHRDYVARLEIDVLKDLTVSVNACHKLYDERLGDPGDLDYRVVSRTKNLFGADIRWSLGDFRLDLEGALGDNAGTAELMANGTDITVVNNAYGAGLYGVHATLSYRWKASDTVTLTPAFMAELFDPDRGRGGNSAVRLAGAVNADIGKHIRLVLSAEGLLEKAADFDSPTIVFLQLNTAF